MRIFTITKMPQPTDTRVNVIGHTFQAGAWLPDVHNDTFKNISHAIATYTQGHKMAYFPRQDGDSPDIVGVFI